VKPDLIFLSEVWIYSFESCLLEINGYTLFSKCNNNYRAGGILSFVKNCWNENSEEIILNMNKADIFKLRFHIKNINITFLAIYRFHGDIKEFLIEFAEILNSEKGQNLIVLGDLNIDILHNNCSKERDDYLNLMSLNGLESCINVPTRVTATCKTCIDHIFLRFRSPGNSKFYSAVFEPGLSDHLMTCLAIQHLKPMDVPKFPSSEIQKKKIDFVLLNIKLRYENWLEVLNCSNPSVAFDSFIKILKCHIDSCTTSYFKKSKQLKTIKPWINQALCRKIKFKNKLSKLCLKYPNCKKTKKRYKKYSKKLKNTVSIEKNNFYKNKFNNARGNLKCEWNIVNTLLNRNTYKNFISSINVDDVLITNKKIIANSFNEKFTNLNFLNSTFSSNSYFENSSSLNLVSDCFQQQSCFLEPISSLELFNLISSLDNSFSTSHLGISNFLLKKISFNIVDILTFLFNFCINAGIFPECLKIAQTIPLFKKGDRKNINNYRPISMLDPLSKIFEKTIKSRTINFLNKISFLSNDQFGFRQGRSTDDALLKFTSEIYESLNSSLKTSALFIDITKAFDCVDHSILLEKLSMIGFRGNVYDLFKSYLSNRKQFVLIDQEISSIKDIKLGVPQGSVLGPILFLIFFNSLLHQRFKGKVTAFADDVAFTYHENTEFELVCNINFDLDLIRRWFYVHKLILSSKTKLMFFSIIKSPLFVDDISYHSGSCCRFNFSNTFNSSLNCSDECFKIEVVEVFIYLGIAVDKHLNWSVHTSNLESYSLSVIRQFYYLKTLCSRDLLRTIYFALFQSRIQYGITCWGGYL